MAAPSPESPPAPAPSDSDGPGATVWRSWLGWFALCWLIDLGVLMWLAQNGLPAPGDEASLASVRGYLLKVGAAIVVAGVLTFSVPVAVVDESSHSESRWWLAWLWPLAWIGMVASDLLAAGYALLPLLKLLKHH